MPMVRIIDFRKPGHAVDTYDTCSRLIDPFGDSPNIMSVEQEAATKAFLEAFGIMTRYEQTNTQIDVRFP